MVAAVALVLVTASVAGPAVLADAGLVSDRTAQELSPVDVADGLLVTAAIVTTVLAGVGAAVLWSHFDTDGKLVVSQELSEQWTDVAELRDTLESTAPLENRVTDMEQTMLSRAQYQVAEARCSGTIESVALSDAQDSADRYTSTIQTNVVSYSNRYMVLVNETSAVWHQQGYDSTTGENYPAYIGNSTAYPAPSEGASLGYTAYTLANGSTRSIVNDTGSINYRYTVLPGDTGTAESLTWRDEAFSESGGDVTANASVFGRLLGETETAHSNVEGQLPAYVSDVYNATSYNSSTDELEGPSGSVVSCDTLKNPASLATDDTSTLSFAEAWAAVSGYNTTSGSEGDLNITVTNGTGVSTTYDPASLVTRATPSTTENGSAAWVTGHQYSASDYSEPIRVYRETGGGVEAVELEDGDSFTINTVEDAENGSVTYSETEYSTYDSSTYTDELEENQEELSTSETGSSGSGLPSKQTLILAALAVGALAVVGVPGGRGR